MLFLFLVANILYIFVFKGEGYYYLTTTLRFGIMELLISKFEATIQRARL